MVEPNLMRTMAKRELPLFIFCFRENWLRLLIFVYFRDNSIYGSCKSFTNVNRVRCKRKLWCCKPECVKLGSYILNVMMHSIKRIVYVLQYKCYHQMNCTCDNIIVLYLLIINVILTVFFIIIIS
jgi:hypothetical protein